MGEVAEPPIAQDGAPAPTLARRVLPRAVLESVSDSGLLRVLKVSPLGTWFMPMGGEGWCFYKKGLIDSLVAAGEYRFADPLRCAAKPLSGYERQLSYARFARFCPVLGDLDAMLTPQGRSALLEQLDPKPTRSTFWLVLRLWLEGGQTPQCLAKPSRVQEAVLASLDRKAVLQMNLEFARSEVRRQVERLLGEPPPVALERDHVASGLPRRRASTLTPTNFRNDIYSYRVMLEHLERKSTQEGKKRSIHSLFEGMCEEDFSIHHPYGPSEPYPAWVKPREGAFEKVYYHFYGHETRRTAKVGEREYGRNDRATPRNDATPSWAAGAEAQLDATVWNALVVTSDDKRLVCGYPVVFRLRCTNTGRLLGVGVSLESASWMGAASAIASCLIPKSVLFASHGVPIDPGQFYVFGMPPRIRADRGETYNKKPKLFMQTTGVIVKNVLAARGDLKGGVESDFYVIQTPLNGMTPSAIIKLYERQHKTKWVAAAHFTLEEFIRFLLVEELKRDEKPRPGKRLPAFMAREGVGTSPREMWEYADARLERSLLDLDMTTVQLSLMERSKAVVTEDGLRFRNVFYSEAGLAARDAFAHARRQGRIALDVANDPRCADNIYLVEGDPTDPDSYTQCAMADRHDQRDWRGKSFREIEVLRRMKEEADARIIAEQEQRRNELTQLQKDEVARSLELQCRAREAHPLTPAQLLALMPAAREAERNRSTPKTAMQPQLRPARSAQEAATTDGTPGDFPATPSTAQSQPAPASPVAPASTLPATQAPVLAAPPPTRLSPSGRSGQSQNWLAALAAFDEQNLAAERKEGDAN